MSWRERRGWWVPCVLLTLLVAACDPTLPDGEFVCSGGGGCPDGWRCLLDDRCYSPSFAGLDTYAPCDVDTDCASGTCLRAFDATADGQCSTACTVSESCPTQPNAGEPGSLGGVCSMGRGCLAACVDADDCNANQVCVVVPMTPGETACVDFASAVFDGRQTCRGLDDCTPGLQCVRAMALDEQGVCAWPCSPGGTCPTGATCEMLPTLITSAGENPNHACLATCNNTPGNCGPLLTCAAFPMMNAHCVPPGWVPP